MEAFERRHDLDWVRVIAIGLLLVYHIAIGFQSWGIMLGFAVNSEPWETLWVPMALLNVWRIPLLFFVSGMGVYFAMQKRSKGQLLMERAKRVLLPFAVGVLILVPLHIFLLQRHYHLEISYTPNPAHLWFLGNIFAYVVLLLPFFYLLKKYEKTETIRQIRKLFSTPWGLLVVLLAFLAEVLLVNPSIYELYAMTWHGFFLGLLAFLFGFLFMFSGSGFWGMLLRHRWLFLVAAISLFTYRLTQPHLKVPLYHLVIESNAWVFSVLAFSYRYLNKPSSILLYLSSAAYPVYILHMLFLTLGSLLIFPLPLGVISKFVLLLVFTTATCFFAYEFLIRRVKWMRPLFGLKGLLPPAETNHFYHLPWVSCQISEGSKNS